MDVAWRWSETPALLKQVSQIVIHDAQTGEALNTIQVDQADPSRLARIVVDPVFRPDGGQIAAVIRPATRVQNRGASAAHGLGRGNRETVVFCSHQREHRATELDYSPDGTEPDRWGRTIDREAAAVFYDATTGERQRSIPLPSSAHVPISSTSATKCSRSCRSDSDVVFWDLATGQERLRLPGYDGDRSITPSVPTAVASSWESPPSPRRRERVDALESEVRPATAGAQSPGHRRQHFAFSPDGNRLVAAFSQSGPTALKPIQIWDATPLPEETIAK